MGKGSLRNKLCKCGSGKKYKNCCMENEEIEKSISKINKNSPFFHIYSYEKNSEIDPKDPDYFYKMSLLSFCTKDEINRIINCRNTNDFLLKLRADYINDNMRIFRTVLSHKREFTNKWSLDKFFETSDFEIFVNKLRDREKMNCKELTSGYLYSSSPNGMVMKTDYGKLMIISYSLKYFLFFMNLYYLDFKTKIPSVVRLNSLRIAIRLMFQHESLDIEIDPRGEVPVEVKEKINVNIDRQLQFVIGHEYSHYLLNHLDDKNTFVKPLIETYKVEEQNKYEFYNTSQKHEFDADIKSIELNSRSLGKELCISDATKFFVYLSIYQHARDIVFPPVNRCMTHPSGEDRIANILNKCSSNSDKDKKIFVDHLNNDIKLASDFLDDDIGFNFEAYEEYGSIYLGPWHKKMLRDRIDY